MMTDQNTKKHRVQFLEWMGHRGTRVILLNFRSDGALLLMEEKPVLGRPMWIRQEDPVKSDWLEAIPVRYGKSHEVEVHFSHPCPRVFLWAATPGNDFRSVEDREETTLTRLE
jgi:hypothetical protein